MSGIREQYEQRYNNVLQPLAASLQKLIEGHFVGVPRIDRISTRAKSVDRFVAKAEKVEGGNLKYADPLNEIQDQIGGRIVTFYLQDVQRIADHVREYFTPIEDRLVQPESDKEFDYVGKHYILFLPSDLFGHGIEAADAPEFFELQIKTLFQHSWSEANHDLGYKPNAPLTGHQRRRIAYSAAQAWGADQIFDQLCRETVAEEASGD